MATEDNGDMGFKDRGGDSILNFPSSVMNSNLLSQKVAGIAMSTGSIFKSSNGADPFFGSGWDSLISLSQSENFGVSSMVPHNEFSNQAHPAVLVNQGINSSSHLVHCQSDSGLGELVPKLPGFGSGSFSELVSSFGPPKCGQINISGRPPNYHQNKKGGSEKTSKNGTLPQEECRLSEKGASPNQKKRRSSESHSPFNPNENAEGEQQKDHSGSGDSSEYLNEKDEKKQKIKQNVVVNFHGKQTGKQAKDNSDSGEAPKENYIHVRAKRGQATNSHSLAERVRREKISERMRLLQELVPGCNKITGKAVMLDEIINYVQSLQKQVEFLSMKLATVNSELNNDIQQILSKDIFHSRRSNAAILGFGQGLSSSHPYLQGIPQGSLPGIPSRTPPFHPMPQIAWDNELQNLLQNGI